MADNVVTDSQDAAFVPIRDEGGKLVCNCSYETKYDPLLIFKNTSITLSELTYRVGHPQETRPKKKKQQNVVSE